MIAVACVRMMQVSVNKVVDMTAVRHCLMPAAWTVNVAITMTGASMAPRTVLGIGCSDLYDMLIGVIAMGEMQVAIVQIINMISVLYGHVTASHTVDMSMIFMNLAVHLETFLGIENLHFCRTRSHAPARFPPTRQRAGPLVHS